MGTYSELLEYAREKAGLKEIDPRSLPLWEAYNASFEELSKRFAYAFALKYYAESSIEELYDIYAAKMKEVMGECVIDGKTLCQMSLEDDNEEGRDALVKVLSVADSILDGIPGVRYFGIGSLNYTSDEHYVYFLVDGIPATFTLSFYDLRDDLVRRKNAKKLIMEGKSPLMIEVLIERIGTCVGERMCEDVSVDGLNKKLKSWLVAGGENYDALWSDKLATERVKDNWHECEILDGEDVVFHDVIEKVPCKKEDAQGMIDKFLESDERTREGIKLFDIFIKTNMQGRRGGKTGGCSEKGNV